MTWHSFALIPPLAITFCAQPLCAQPQFEVASVKVANSGYNGVRGGCRGIDSRHNLLQAEKTVPLGRCVITDGRLGHIIGIAFELGAGQEIKGGPDWVTIGTDRFNVEAKADDASKATEAQLLQMLQALLIERFDLKFHRESANVQGFALVVAKNGAKLKASQEDEPSTRFVGSVKLSGGPVSVMGRKYSMPMLANIVSMIARAPVADKTGLEGAYDFDLNWDDNDGPQFTTALPTQLGLRMEPQKVTVSHFVIDSARKPSSN